MFAFISFLVVPQPSTINKTTMLQPKMYSRWAVCLGRRTLHMSSHPVNELRILKAVSNVSVTLSFCQETPWSRELDMRRGGEHKREENSFCPWRKPLGLHARTSLLPRPLVS